MAAPAPRLHVSRCSCETGRQRHHLLPGSRIAYDSPADAPHSGPTGHMPPVNAPGQPGNTGTPPVEDEVTVDESDGGSDEGPGIALQGQQDPYNLLLSLYEQTTPGSNPIASVADGGDSNGEEQPGGDENGTGSNTPGLPFIVAINAGQAGGISVNNPGFEMLPLLNQGTALPAELLVPAPTAGQAALPGIQIDWQVFGDDDDESDFGDGSFLDSDSDAPDSMSEPDELTPPRIAPWRLNLTGLSQIYNFYVTAYRDQIHISRPRSCVTNKLPPSADLILRPGASARGLVIGGHVDDIFPHQVNHLIIGDLGDEEILLMAYDDGDVIAYYTRQIEDALLGKSRQDHYGSAAIVPQPFFHENVGKSAWGLAIHAKSRMIAVGNNLRAVNVFAFALAGKSCTSLTSELEKEPPGLFRSLHYDPAGTLALDQGFMAHLPTSDEFDRAACIAAVDKSFRERDANWHLQFDTGYAGHNMPNVTFSSSGKRDGAVDKVVSIDIRGTVWLMDLDKIRSYAPYARIDSLRRPPQRGPGVFHDDVRPRGWGVLVLPESSFMPTRKSWPEALGINESEAKYAYSDKIGRWIDISAGILRIKDNSDQHPWVRHGQRSRFVLNLQDRELQNYSRPWFDPYVKGWPSMNSPRLKGISSPKGRNSPSSRSKRLQNDYDYHNSKTQQSHQTPLRTRNILGDGSSILRTYELDIELRSHEEGGVGIMLEDAIRQEKPANLVIPAMRASHERLSNLIHIPELSLVVAASMCGRVALITLTRPTMPKNTEVPFARGMKIEKILPTTEDEDQRLRPICPLLGVASAPMPFDDIRRYTYGSKRHSAPRRYRLMLHYYDLRILTYEIGRGSPMDPLSVV